MIEMRSVFVLLLMALASCSTFDVASAPLGKAETLFTQTTTNTETLTILSAIGGLCLVAGMVLLVFTRGSRGWFSVIGGVIFVLLNYMVAEYSHLLFYPLVAFTGLISGAWTYRIVKQILIERQSK